MLTEAMVRELRCSQYFPALNMSCLLLFVVIAWLPSAGNAEVVLELPKTSLNYASLESNFGAKLTSQGCTGKLELASPSIYACTPLQPAALNTTATVLLVKRGPPADPCDYGVKVRKMAAQRIANS
jgi:hypothetical protein